MTPGLAPVEVDRLVNTVNTDLKRSRYRRRPQDPTLPSRFGCGTIRSEHGLSLDPSQRDSGRSHQGMEETERRDNVARSKAIYQRFRNQHSGVKQNTIT